MMDPYEPEIKVRSKVTIKMDGRDVKKMAGAMKMLQKEVGNKLPTGLDADVQNVVNFWIDLANRVSERGA